MSAFGNPLPNGNTFGKPFGMDKNQRSGNNPSNGPNNGFTGGNKNGNPKKKPFTKNPNNPKFSSKDPKPFNKRKPRIQQLQNTNQRSGTTSGDGMEGEMDEELDFEDPQIKIIPKTNINYQSYSIDEINIIGPIIRNPEKYGFHRKNVAAREVPKYLQIQSRVIEPMPFRQDPWDKANQEKMNLMEQQNNGNDFQGLYEEFQRMREIERKKMEDLGLVDAENTRKDLNDAIAFQGTCLDMCPTFERVRRALENNVKNLEKDPVTNKIIKSKAVKAFSRPAAGQPPSLPSDVRPPFVLVQSLNYLIDNMVPILPESHSFLWDRTRSIRQDFTYQNYFGPEAIECNEKIVRIHLISLHIMAGSDVEYSQQQELEQFNKALQTLIEIYQDVRNRGGYCPNEAEFRSYYLISHLRDNEVETELQTLPTSVLKHPLIKLCLKFRTLAAQGNRIERGNKNTVGCLNLYVEFFRLVYSSETPFLLACLLETQFNEIRFYALKAMTRAYHTKDKAYDGASLSSILGFDSVEKLIKFVQYYEVDIINENGTFLIDLVNREKLETQYKLNSINEKPKLAQPYSPQLNSKIDKPLAEFINCGESNHDLHLRSTKEVMKGTAFELPVTRTFSSSNSEYKSGSFADFLSKPSAQGVQSQSVQPSTIQHPIQPQALQAPVQPQGLQAPAQPQSFQGFGSESKLEEKKIEPSFQTKPKMESTFKFGSAPPTKEPMKLGSILESKKEEPKFNFGSSTAGGSQEKVDTVPKLDFSIPKVDSLKPKIDFTVPKTDSSVKPNFSMPKSDPIVAKIEPKPTITKSPYFFQANKQTTDLIIDQVVTEELNRILPKLIKRDNAHKERERVISSLSKELYHAFLNEIIYEVSKDVQADNVFIKNTKRKYIRKLQEVGERLKIKQRMKRKRKAELEDTKFNSTKRLSSNTSFSSVSSTKRRGVWDETSIDEIVIQRNEIERLWRPLDLKGFLNTCSNNLSKQLEIKFLVVVENWKMNYSKWLINKLDLKLDESKTKYTNKVSTDTMTMSITSLPNKEYLNKEFFSNSSFILFECGLLQLTDQFPTIDKKLQRDGLILQRILQLIDKFAYYKVGIIIVFWDITNSKLGQDQISKYLGIKLNESINNIVICDMSKEECNINDIITEGFGSLASQFKGDLTIKGAKKSKNLVEYKSESKEIDNNKFANNEIRIKNKAKLDKKFSYLNNHSFGGDRTIDRTIDRSFNGNRTMNGMNTTMNNTMNRMGSRIGSNRIMNRIGSNGNRTMNTVNGTFNQTVNQTVNQTANQTANLTANLTLGNLSGFGNGIIEESTPFNSPNKFVKPKPKSSLQELIDLTTRVRSKYKS